MPGPCRRQRNRACRRPGRARRRSVPGGASTGSRSRSGCRGRGRRRRGRPRCPPAPSLHRQSSGPPPRRASAQRSAARPPLTEIDAPAGRSDGRGARQPEQVVDERFQPVELASAFAACSAAVAAFGPDGLQPELDPRQRRAQLMGGVGDEVALGGEVGRQLVGHAVERRARARRSPAAPSVDPRVEIAAPEPARRGASVSTGRASVPARIQASTRPAAMTARPISASASQLERTLASTAAVGAETRSAPTTLVAVDDGDGHERSSSPSVSLNGGRVDAAAERRAGTRAVRRSRTPCRVAAGRPCRRGPPVSSTTTVRSPGPAASPTTMRTSAAEGCGAVAATRGATRSAIRAERRAASATRPTRARRRPAVDAQRERDGEREDDRGQQVGRREDEAAAKAHRQLVAAKRKPTPRTVWM